MRTPLAALCLATAALLPPAAAEDFPPGAGVELEARGPGSVACVTIGHVTRCESGSPPAGGAKPALPGRRHRERGVAVRPEPEAAVRARRQADAVRRCTETVPAVRLAGCIGDVLRR